MSTGTSIEGTGNINSLGGVQIISPTNGQTLVYNSVTQLWVNSSGGGATGYQTIQGGGTAYPQETTLNFIGATVTVADDPGNNRTNVTISSGAATGYQTIENQGTAVAQETTFNFATTGITAVDNAGQSRTDISLASSLVDVAALSPTLDTLIYGNGTHFTNAALTQQQTVYVALNGSDTTGNGSILFPYRTLAHANSTITDAANLKKYVVAFLGGRFDETVNVVLKPYVSYAGFGSSFSYITSPNNEIGPDSSYSNANGRTSIMNLYIGGSTGINWDLSGLGTTGSAVLDLVCVQMNGGLTYIGRDNGADFLQTEGGTYWIGNTQLSNCQVTIIGGWSGGTFTWDTASTTGHSLGDIFGFQFNGNVSIASTSSITMDISIQQSPMASGTLSISGATTTVTIDNSSLPLLSSNYTVSGGAAVSFLNSDWGIASSYTPTYYTPTSSTVDGNFHGIDNALASIVTGGFVWNVTTGTSATMVKNNGYFANNASTVTYTLPTTTAVGDTFQVENMQGGWIVAQNSGQTIKSGPYTTTTGTGGSLASTAVGDWVTIVCNIANTGFVAKIEQGMIGIV